MVILQVLWGYTTLLILMLVNSIHRSTAVEMASVTGVRKIAVRVQEIVMENRMVILRDGSVARVPAIFAMGQAVVHRHVQERDLGQLFVLVLHRAVEEGVVQVVIQLFPRCRLLLSLPKVRYVKHVAYFIRLNFASISLIRIHNSI